MSRTSPTAVPTSSRALGVARPPPRSLRQIAPYRGTPGGTGSPGYASPREDPPVSPPRRPRNVRAERGTSRARPSRRPAPGRRRGSHPPPAPAPSAAPTRGGRAVGPGGQAAPGLPWSRGSSVAPGADGSADAVPHRSGEFRSKCRQRSDKPRPRRRVQEDRLGSTRLNCCVQATRPAATPWRRVRPTQAGPASRRRSPSARSIRGRP